MFSHRDTRIEPKPVVTLHKDPDYIAFRSGVEAQYYRNSKKDEK